MSEQAAISPAAAQAPGRNEKLRVATVWLGGCSGCHMSFLDLDERLLALVEHADVVYSPIMDVKEFPEGVDVTLVEGAVVNEDHVETIKKVRERSKLLVALGDCAVTGNVPALRNLLRVEQVLQAAYVDRATTQPQVPYEPGIVPRLLPRVHPLHRVVHVDVYLPGCPPSADRIWGAVTAVIEGRPLGNGPAPKFG